MHPRAHSSSIWCRYYHWFGLLFLCSILGSWWLSDSEATKRGEVQLTDSSSEDQSLGFQEPADRYEHDDASCETPTQSTLSSENMEIEEPSVANEQQSLWRAFHEAQHAVVVPEPRQLTNPENENVRYFIANPGQDLTMRFLDSGARLHSGQPGKDWAGLFRAKSGKDGRAVRATGSNRVEYRDSALVEWFENRVEGIEHGLTLLQRPMGAPDGPAVVRIEVQGLATSDLKNGDIGLADDSGHLVARYGKLKVWDSGGTALVAGMHSTAEGVEIRVEDEGAIYPVTIDPLIVTMEAKLVPEMTGDGRGGDEFGASVAIDGDVALIGAQSADLPGATNGGSVYVFVRSGGEWALEAKLTASDAEAGDQFGAAAALSGDIAVVGAPLKDFVGEASHGAAYVFVRSGGSWPEQARFMSSDHTLGDQFGRSVDIDGTTLIVGAHLADTINGADSGAAYIFDRTESFTWPEQQKLTAFDGEASDLFGWSVSISGSSAVVGAHKKNTVVGDDAGAAYVYVRSGVTWSLEEQLFHPSPEALDRFGFSVSLDADTLLVGAYLDHTQAGDEAGSAHIFVRLGSNWTHEAMLTAGDGASNDRFGRSAALSGDTAVVGAIDDATSISVLAGSAYVFVRTEAVWTQQAKLIDLSGKFNDQFGVNLAMDGDTAIIGANFDDTTAGMDAGSAFVFDRSGAVWSETIQLSVGNGADYDRFGLSLDVEGSTLVLGCQYADTLQGANSGEAYVFVDSSSDWTLQARLLGSGINASDEFSSVALSGETIVVGARWAHANAGSAYVFVRNQNAWIEQTELQAFDAASNDAFGDSVGIDGDTIVVGAREDDTLFGVNSGSAYVFDRAEGVWSFTQQLTASDAGPNDRFAPCAIEGDLIVVTSWRDTKGPGKAYVFRREMGSWTEETTLVPDDGIFGDGFGYDLDIFGSRVLIGADDHDLGGLSGSGSAYVFVYSDGTWLQEAKLVANDPGVGDNFGHSVALYGDVAAIGAWSHDLPGLGNAGAVYAFQRDVSGWNQIEKISAPDAGVGDFFGGYSIALDQDLLIVSAVLDDSPFDTFLPGYSVFNHGSVYVFRIEGPEIVVEHPIGVALVDGVSVIDFGNVLLEGLMPERDLVIRNIGITDLQALGSSVVGTDPAAFVLDESSLPSSIAPLGQGSLRIVFSPSRKGVHTATLTVGSNDIDENPFDLTLQGTVFSSQSDTDEDGMNDWQELNLSILGFDWQIPNPDHVAAYYSMANLNGLFTSAQLQALNVETPLIVRDPTSGEFVLTIGLEKSMDLSQFDPFPLMPTQIMVNGDGKLELRFTVPDNAAFFQLLAE